MDWKLKGGRSEEVRNIELLYNRTYRDAGVFMGWAEDCNEFIDDDVELPSDADVMNMMRNVLNEGQAARVSKRKIKLMTNMYD
jgi:hypothetical protein